MAYNYTKFAGSPDIFENTSGRVITEDEARKAGLFTPTGLSSIVEQRTAPRPDVKVETDFARLSRQNLDPSLLTTPNAVTTTDGIRTGLDKVGLTAGDIVNQDFKTDADFTGFMQDIRDRFQKTDDQISKISSLSAPTDDEKVVADDIAELENILTEMTQGAGERPLDGTFLKSALASEIQNITSGNTRESLVLLRRMDTLNKKLTRLQGNRQAQFDALKLEYDLGRQSINDAINFYKLTAPEQIATDEETGKVWFRNPITGEVSVSQLPEFTPKENQPASVEEYNYLLKNGLIPKGTSYVGYQQLKATQFGTEKSGSDKTSPVIAGVKVTDPTLDVIDGIRHLADLTADERTKVIADLRKLGFYSEVPPAWFKTEAEQQAQASLTTKHLTDLWNQTRKSVTDATSKTTGGSNSLPTGLQ